jgi:alpha-L-fucosidase
LFLRRFINNFFNLFPQELLKLLVSTVSCGGNILINVGPSKEGTIIPIFQERLSQLGTWLKSNGEAIYASVPWNYQNDSMSAQHEVWYTAGKGALSGNVYALVIGWPKDEKLILGSVRADSGSAKVDIIGLDRELEFKQTRLLYFKLCYFNKMLSIFKIIN